MLLLLGLLLASASTSLAVCPPDTTYESLFNKCYKYYNSPMPFLAAERQCNSIGGNLVAVQSGFENSYVSGIASGASGRTPNFWIGANQLLSASWSWTYNTSMSYINWAPGQPGAGYPCGLIRNSDSKWISGACNSALPFVCTVDSNAQQPGYCPTQQPTPACPSSPTCSDDAVCSPGYTLYAGNNICYKYIKTYYTFTDAVKNCAQDDATLVKIDTPELNNFLAISFGIDVCGNTTGGCPLIGLKCSNGSVSSCYWQDGSVAAYTNFLFSDGQTPSPNVIFYLVTSLSNSYDFGFWEILAAQAPIASICQKPANSVSLLMATTEKKRKEEHSKNTGIQKQNFS